QGQKPEVHDRLFAALQPEIRLREEDDPRRHDRQAGERARQPAHHARPGHQDQRPHQALAGGDGGDARPRLRAVVPRAGAPGARVLAGELRRDARGERQGDRRHAMAHGDDGQRPVVRGRRRLEPAARLSELLHHLDRDGRHRGRGDGRRQPPRRSREHGRQGNAAAAVDHAGRVRRAYLRRPDGRRDGPLPRGGGARPAGAGHPRARAHGDGGLPRRRSLRRAQRGGGPAVEMAKKNPQRIGLAIVGAGRIGLFRGEVAARHPQVDFIGIADLRKDRLRLVGDKTRADFVTTDFRELLKTPEVTAAIVSTDEHLHVEPILSALEGKLSLLIEKPLATELADSQRVLSAIEKSGVDAVVGYTQRFRRRWLVAKEKVRTGQLGEVTLVTSRAFMNRLVALDNYRRTSDPSKISPMVISGTHALDIVMWLMEAKRPVEIYARSVDKALGPLCKGIDATAGVITFDDGSLYHAAISWALPIVWPGAVYSLEVGITGTEGVLTIDDTHRDIVLATTRSQGEGYAPAQERRVDFLGSYPPGDIALGELRGPMREETEQWLNRISMGLPTQHATAAEAHNRLMLTKAFDLSARLK